MLLESWCSTGFFWKVENNVSVLFIVLNLLPVKIHVFKRSFIFYTFVCKQGALHLRLHVVSLPASVTMSWPANITSKLNMSGLNFLVPVSQSSSNFDLNVFVQVLLSLIRTVCRRNVKLLLSESLGLTVSLCKVENFFLFFFRSEASNDFPVKSMFSEGLFFLHF